MNIHQISTTTIALDREAHRWANQFAAQQTTIAKGKRVYLNTLAVCAVRQYLSQVCAIDIELSQGDCWQEGLQTVMDRADVVIPHVGKLECRPVLPQATAMYVPPEMIDGLEPPLGYVAVQFSEDLSTVELLGFIARPTEEWTALEQLAPLEDLLAAIYTVRVEKLRDLLAKQWGTWKSIETLVPKRQEFAVRSLDSEVVAGKIINLQAKITDIPILLLIGLNAEDDGRIKVKARLHSAGTEQTLPANLKLVLQNKDGKCQQEVCYPQAMDFIQLQSFKLNNGTEFKLQVALGSSSFTESFIA